MHEQVKKSTKQQYAAIQKITIPAFTDFTAMCDNEKEKFTSWIDDNATTAYIKAYNPFTWELCHYHMTTDLEMIKKSAKDSLIYDVHHIS